MYRFFKCNRLGGFRLTDLNRKVYTDEYLYFDKHVCDTSKSINGALKAKWMLEVTEEVASRHVSVPGKVEVVKSESVGITKKDIGKIQVDAKEANKSLESRQAERNFRRTPMQKQKKDDKPAVPNFNKAERSMRLRQADIMTKGPDELLKSPVQKIIAKKHVETTKGYDDLLKILNSQVQKEPEVVITDEVLNSLSHMPATVDQLWRSTKASLSNGLYLSPEKAVGVIPILARHTQQLEGKFEVVVQKEPEVIVTDEVLNSSVQKEFEVIIETKSSNETLNSQVQKESEVIVTDEVLNCPVQKEPEVIATDEVLNCPVQKEPEVIIIKPKNDVVENLAKEIKADNSLLSTPNFDEKRQDNKEEKKKKVKKEITKEIQKRVTKRRRKETSAQEA